MCIIILSSRIYVRRHPNDEIFVLLLTNTGHFLILELGSYDYRKEVIPLPRYYRQLCPHYRGYRGNTVVPITVQLTTSDTTRAVMTEQTNAGDYRQTQR